MYNLIITPNNSKLIILLLLQVAGGNDWLGDTRDVMWLINTIHHTLVDVIFIDKYNHDDYIQGMDAPQLVFEPLMKIMERYTKWDEDEDEKPDEDEKLRGEF